MRQQGGYQGQAEVEQLPPSLISRSWGSREGEEARGCPALASLLPIFPAFPRSAPALPGDLAGEAEPRL